MNPKHGIFRYNKGLPWQEYWQMEGIARLEVGEALGDLECHVPECRKESHLLSLRKESYISGTAVCWWWPACSVTMVQPINTGLPRK